MVRVRERSRRAPVSVEEPIKRSSVSFRRYIELSYHIIEHKIMYYYPELIKVGYHRGLEISDDAYDALEIEYLKLCKELGEKNTVVHKGYAGLEVEGPGMMEVDFTRPVVHLIMRKYGISNWQDKVPNSSERPDPIYFAHLKKDAKKHLTKKV